MKVKLASYDRLTHSRLGSAETCIDVPNRLDTTEGWNFLMRIYRPGKSVLEGAYILPETKRVK